MHTSYELNLGREPDFRVRYRFYDKEEGGRSIPPSQGYRSNFWYFNESHAHIEKGIFMIHPEFENSNGEIILQDDVSVEKVGTDRMWIVNQHWRAYHNEKIKIGMTGYFMEGPKKVAECVVIELISISFV
jgi:hypothetical protein